LHINFAIRDKSLNFAPDLLFKIASGYAILTGTAYFEAFFLSPQS
jgi:hypothetical protein